MAFTVGQTIAGPQSNAISADTIRVNKYTIPAGIRFFKLTTNFNLTGSIPIRAVIYLDSAGEPGALARCGPETTFPASGTNWYDNALEYTTPAAGDYWFGAWSGGLASVSVNSFLAAGIPRRVNNAQVYSSSGPAPNPWPGTVASDDTQFSWYLTAIVDPTLVMGTLGTGRV